jgi:hypothetical protein
MTLKQVYRPIQTPVGLLVGRDAIFLDTMKFCDDGSGLLLTGEINCKLASFNPPGQWMGYTLSFFGVSALKMIELDSTYNGQIYESMGKSSFGEIINSHWISSLGGKVTTDDRHFIVATYDYVFEIVCRKFELKFTSSEEM